MSTMSDTTHRGDPDPASPGARLLRAWTRLAPLPGGRWVFSRMVGRTAPYTGSIGARVLELAPGRARIEMRDRRRLRNHLSSLHALALANLGEVTSGLAMLPSVPPTVRGIVTGLSAEYVKKARGRVVAECRAEPPATVTEPVDFEVMAEIRDAEGEVTTRVRVSWRLAPRE